MIVANSKPKHPMQDQEKEENQVKSKMETFNEVVGGILKQGRPAMVGGSCRYRAAPDDLILKCAAGQLIPDESYHTDLEICGKVEADNRVGNLLAGLGHDLPLVRALQIAHDRAALTTVFHEEFLASFRVRADHVAREFDLHSIDGFVEVLYP